MLCQLHCLSRYNRAEWLARAPFRCASARATGTWRTDNDTAAPTPASAEATHSRHSVRSPRPHASARRTNTTSQPDAGRLAESFLRTCPPPLSLMLTSSRDCFLDAGSSSAKGWTGRRHLEHLVTLTLALTFGATRLGHSTDNSVYVSAKPAVSRQASRQARALEPNKTGQTKRYIRPRSPTRTAKAYYIYTD